MKKPAALLLALLGIVWCRAQNHAPDIAGNASAIGCFEDTVCFELSTSDFDNDSTFLWWQPAHNGSFQKNNGKFESGKICFYLSENNFSAITLYNFNVFVTDRKDTLKRSFGFYILDLPKNIKPAVESVSCNIIDIQPMGDSSVNWDKYKVEDLKLNIKDSTGKIINTLVSLHHNPAFFNTHTNYTYSLTYTMRTGCTHTVTDSIFINKGARASIFASENLLAPVKEWTRLDLQAQITDSNGYTSFDYLWLPGLQKTSAITVYPVKDSRYTVSVKTSDGCESRAETNVKVTLTGRNEISRPRVTILPNPATDFISIIGLPGNASVQISDIAGREVIMTDIYERIDISGLATGVYFVTVTGDRLYERVKFVKE